MIQDIFAIDAWKEISSNNNVLLLDVRTNSEWSLVGVPDLSDDKIVKISLLKDPNMDFNNNFVAEFQEKFTGNQDSKVFCLCRSGKRSLKAAQILAELGYNNLYNITDGFEGGNASNDNQALGWKNSGLPWKLN